MTMRGLTLTCVTAALMAARAIPAQADDLDFLLPPGDAQVQSTASPDTDAQAYDEEVAVEPLREDAATPAAEPRRRLGLSTVEEIVVTAQKREESLSDVSIAVSAFSGEDMAALGITDTRDLSTFIPGFSYADSGYTVPIYSLRGVGFNESSQTASSTVGIYVDEQNLAFPVFSKGTNLDLERVEVLKGPQGTLYGRNTTGGAVNYIANKPTETFEAGFGVSYGNYQTLDADGYVSGPLSDTLRARLAYRTIQSNEGWQYSITRGEDGPSGTLGEIAKQSGRLTLDWLPSDVFTTSLTLSGWTDDSEPQAPQAIGFQPQNAVTGGLVGDLALAPSVRNHPLVPADTDDARVADWVADFDWRLNETFWMAALRSDWDFADTTRLTFLASYADFENDHALIPQSGLSVINTERDLLVDTSAYAFELRLDGRAGDRIDWLAGAYLSHDDVYEYQSIFIDTNSAAFGLPVPIVGPIVGPLLSDRVDTYGEQVADTWALFLNGGLHLADAFKLNLGLRYTSEIRKFKGCSIDSPYGTTGVGFSPVINLLSLSRGGSGGAMRGGCFTMDPETANPGLFEGTLDESNVSGRIALDWTPADDQLLYVSFSRGFKSGSFPVFASSDQAQYLPATQEQLHAWELGGKTAFLERRLRFNFAGFFYDYKDKQLVGRIVDPLFGPLQKLVNAPKSEVYGVEAELQASPFEGLFLALSAIYLKTEVIEYEGLDQSGDPVNLAGEPFNFSPEIEYTLLVDYVRPLTERWDIGFGLDYAWTDQTNSVLTGDELFVIESYGLLNARLNLIASDGGWRFSLWARNLTDEYYSHGVFNTGDTIGRYAGMPRTYGVSAAYSFQ
jgi:iron complex outermembrane recepter protein